MLVRISSNYFVAGLIVEDDKVIKAAPIIKYMKGWQPVKVLDYCIRKNWEYEIVNAP